MYHGILVHMSTHPSTKGFVDVERIQTGVRMEKRLLKVLKALAELRDMTLGDLLEGIVLHALEGRPLSLQARSRKLNNSAHSMACSLRLEIAITCARNLAPKRNSHERSQLWPTSCRHRP